MTIGIGASGPNAGLAVFRALQAAERVATGAIGGFVTYAALGENGTLHRAETQRGGTATLFTRGEATGTEPPPEVAATPFAALISSGPDRPAPLSQFLAAAAGVGLVSGHRLPNTAGPDGRMVNEAVLARMAEGESAAAALAAVLGALPSVDAGMIALGPGRGISALNSALVETRPDLGHARAEADGTVVEVLHNAIRPQKSLAPLVAEIALGVMRPPASPAGEALVRAGTPLVAAAAKALIVDAGGIALRIETDVEAFLTGTHNCAAVYLGTPVVRDGTVLGTTTMEPNMVVRDGAVVSLSGQSAVAIPYAKGG